MTVVNVPTATDRRTPILALEFNLLKCHVALVALAMRAFAHFAEKRGFRFRAVQLTLVPWLEETGFRIYLMEDAPMARNKFVAGLILLLLSAAAYAQPSRSANGCALLEKLVRDSVYTAATESDVNRPRHRARLGRQGTVRTVGSRQMCSNTTEVATRAFTEALSGLNMHVSWNEPRIGYDGPICLSVDPGACSPNYNPWNPTFPGNRHLFVHDAWQGVRNAIASQMPFGTASGVSNFTAESLDAALSSHLNVSVDGPIYSSYSRYSGFGGRRPAKR